MEALDRIVTEISDKISGIIERYKDAPGSQGPIKYIRDIPLYVGKAYRRYHFLGLDEVDGLRVLDLCTGAGYFTYICNKNHDAIGLDWPEYFTAGSSEHISDVPSLADNDIGISLYKDLAEALSNTVYNCRIELGESFMVGQRFDVITAFYPCFNRRPEDNYFWGKDDWDSFIGYVIKSHLTPNGRLVVTPLKREKGAGIRELTELFVTKYGGSCKSNTFTVGA